MTSDLVITYGRNKNKNFPKKFNRKLDNGDTHLNMKYLFFRRFITVMTAYRSQVAVTRSKTITLKAFKTTCAKANKKWVTLQFTITPGNCIEKNSYLMYSRSQARPFSAKSQFKSGNWYCLIMVPYCVNDSSAANCKLTQLQCFPINWRMWWVLEKYSSCEDSKY